MSEPLRPEIVNTYPAGDVPAAEMIRRIEAWRAHTHRLDHKPVENDECNYAEGYRAALDDVENLIRTLTP